MVPPAAELVGCNACTSQFIANANAARALCLYKAGSCMTSNCCFSMHRLFCTDCFATEIRRRAIGASLCCCAHFHKKHCQFLAYAARGADQVPTWECPNEYIPRAFPLLIYPTFLYIPPPFVNLIEDAKQLHKSSSKHKIASHFA